MDAEVRFMPEQASSFAGEVDRLYAFLWAVSGAMTILIGALILYFAIKYRRGSKADRTQTATHFFLIEATWILGPFAVVMVMFFWGARLYFHQSRAPAHAMEITGVGRQWMWKFQHPDGRSEINDLHVPLGQPIKVRLISEDVIHSMFVPAFRQKQDVLPGRYTQFWFEPTKVGKYHLFCAEYCGAKHSEMRGYVYVMEPSKYQEWLSGTVPTQSMASAGENLFERFRCASCHQGGGMTSKGPPLENLYGSTVKLQDGRTVVADENYLRESIVRPQAKIVAGFPSIMPTFEGLIDENGINQLIAEIKSLGRGDRPREGDEETKQQPEGGPEQKKLDPQDKPSP
jgi:cytochrome c oxidase subunit 2